MAFPRVYFYDPGESSSLLYPERENNTHFVPWKESMREAEASETKDGKERWQAGAEGVAAAAIPPYRPGRHRLSQRAGLWRAGFGYQRRHFQVNTRRF